MSVQGLTKEQRAMKYYVHAAEFIDAYGKLSRADVEATDVMKDLMQTSVKQLILGHALELVMKGWLVLYEGNPVSLTKQQRKALVQSGQSVPMTLKDYGHDLEKLAAAAVKYDVDIHPYIDKTIPILDETASPALDEQGHIRMKSIIEHLNSSYWASGARQYEYPESDEVAERKSIALLRPLDQFAEFVSTSRHKLLNAIMHQNGDVVPSLY